MVQNFSETVSRSAVQKILEILWNIRSSLPCSKEPTTVARPGKDECSPQSIILRQILILRSLSCPGIPRSYFLSDSVVRFLYNLSETLELINELQAVCMLRYRVHIEIIHTKYEKTVLFFTHN
jgi:hypothetical protein